MSNSDLGDIWTLKPKLGLGKIRFGMDRSVVNEFPDYGSVTRSRDWASMPADDAANFLRSLGVDEDSIEATVQAHTAASRPYAITDVRTNGLLFEYEHDKLVEIMATPETKELHLNDLRIFEGKPFEVIAVMSSILREVPIIGKEEVVFPEHYFYLFEFLRETSTGYAEGDKKERSLSWRATPLVGGTDISPYKPLKL